VAAEKKQILWLNIQVQQPMPQVQHIQCFRSFPQVAKQFIAGNARLSRMAIFLPQGVQISVRQLQDDYQSIAKPFYALDGKQKWMPDRLHQLQGCQFVFGGGALNVEGVEAALDKLDGLKQSAGGFAFPHLAEPPAAEGFDQPVTRQHFVAGPGHQCFDDGPTFAHCFAWWHAT
jgi:hypothetical protein